MDLAICSLASGSSGNCYLVRSPRTALLVDAGISFRQIRQRLAALGLAPGDISALLITHEHSDHIRSLEAAAKATGAAVCMSRGTADAIGLDEKSVSALQDGGGGLLAFSAGSGFTVGDIEVSSFRLSHDAEDPVGYSFSSGGRSLCIVTDTGTVTEEIFEAARRADILVLESNHDVNMLRIGRYPWFLKQRILSDRGHLSNDSSAQILLRMLEGEEPGTERERIVLLAHLSKENNFPEMALATVQGELERGGYIAGNRILIETLSRTEQSPLYWV